MFKPGCKYRATTKSDLEGIWEFNKRELDFDIITLVLLKPEGRGIFKPGQIWYVNSHNWEKWIEFKPITKKTYHPEFF